MFGFNTGLEKINTLIAKQKYPAAVKLLRKAIQADPQNLFLRKQMCELLPKVGADKEGINLLITLANTYAAKGYFTRALALYKQGERLYPEHRQLLGMLLNKMVKKQKEDEKDDQVFGNSIEVTTTDEELEIIKEGQENFAAHLAANPNVDNLLNSPLFKAFSKDELADLLEEMEICSYQPGEIIFTEGQQGESLMVLISGGVRVYVRAETGQSRQVRILEEGAFFGEISLITAGPRTATLTCMSSAEVLVLSKDALFELARKHKEIPEIVREFCQKRAGSKEEIEAREGKPNPMDIELDLEEED